MLARRPALRIPSTPTSTTTNWGDRTTVAGPAKGAGKTPKCVNYPDISSTIAAIQTEIRFANEKLGSSARPRGSIAIALAIGTARAPPVTLKTKEARKTLSWRLGCSLRGLIGISLSD
ncbi:hypothetical protein Trydic_g6442 [Trypoxylus dichotomus]